MMTTPFPASQWLTDGERTGVGLARESAGMPVMTQLCRQEVLELSWGTWTQRCSQADGLGRCLGDRSTGLGERRRGVGGEAGEVSRWPLGFLLQTLDERMGVMTTEFQLQREDWEPQL